jgi:hypothetical protein
MRRRSLIFGNRSWKHSCSNEIMRVLNIRLTDELFRWLKNTARITGIPMGRIVREHLEEVKARQGKQRFLRHLGAIKGPPDDLSSRKGFSRE